MITVEAFLEGRILLHCGDCLLAMDSLPENSIDSIVCDPPYHLNSIVKRFGKTSNVDDTGTSARARAGADGMARLSRGFMGKQWDGGDIAFQVSTWERCYRVLKPGGYILAFSSSRTFGRMSVAIEDAGFITHPMIGWIFGQGFPKAHRIMASGLSDLDRATGGWEGWRYGAQSLKPALEPIYMGQKPFDQETGTANVLEWGTGAVNIDGCRIEARDGVPQFTHRGEAAVTCYGDGRSGSNRTGELDRQTGRWPANVVLSWPEDEYTLHRDVTTEQKRELYRWLSENA